MLKSITRKDIRDRLPNSHPIDCFFFQLSYPFSKKWVKIKQELQDKIAEITDDFLASKENQKFGEWFRFEDCWSLTYFLDAQGNSSQPSRDIDLIQHLSKFEEDLNLKVRLKLREKLKEKDPSLPDMHIIIMRACKYVGAESMDM